MAEIRCIICGASAIEVRKLFCFPTNPERYQMWMKILGFKYSGSGKHYRICDRHFSNDSYMNSSCSKLKRDAVPMPWVIPSSAVPANEEENEPFVINEVHAGPSSSAFLATGDLKSEIPNVEVDLKTPYTSQPELNNSCDIAKSSSDEIISQNLPMDSHEKSLIKLRNMYLREKFKARKYRRLLRNCAKKYKLLKNQKAYSCKSSI